jgi:primosomal protein N' (replication factor Y) (superfamily II helicase)
MGLQKIEKVINEQFPTCKTLLIDAEKAASLSKMQHLTQEISGARCIIATSLLQTPPTNWQPDAIIVLRADSMLSIPDWKVAEHCYHMLQNIIANNSCPIIIQAYTPLHYAITAACKINDAFFWQEENVYREQYEYPPYGEMAIVLYRHEIEETMFTRVNKLYQEFLFLQEKDKFKGEIFATPPLIYKMYDKYRYNIVLKGKNLRPFLENAFVQLKIRERGFKIDWLPENIV